MILALSSSQYPEVPSTPMMGLCRSQSPNREIPNREIPKRDSARTISIDGSLLDILSVILSGIRIHRRIGSMVSLAWPSITVVLKIVFNQECIQYRTRYFGFHRSDLRVQPPFIDH